MPCSHRQHPLRQRVLGIALGYEDLNDHDTQRTLKEVTGTDSLPAAW